MKSYEMRDAVSMTGLAFEDDESRDDGSDTNLRPQGSGGGEAPSTSRWFVGLLATALTGVLVVCVVVLFVLVTKLPTASTTTNSAVLTQLLLPSSASAAAGLGVSLTRSGRVQPGAGITIYKNVAPSVLRSVRCADYVGMSAFGTDSYLVAYSSSSISWSTSSLVALRVGGTRVGVSSLVGPVKQVGYSVFQVATLASTATSTTFVALCQMNPPVGTPSAPATVIPGRIDHATHAITLFQPVAYTQGFSVTPSITALSPTSFAVAYFSADYVNVKVRYGYVGTEAASGAAQITLSAETQALYQPTYGVVFELAALSPSILLLAYYNGSDFDKVNNQVGQMKVIPMTVSLPGAVNATLTAGVTAALPDSRATSYFALSALSPTSAVIAFVDASRNNGLTTTSLELSAQGSLLFTSVLPVTTGTTLSIVASFTLVALDMTLVSPDEVAIVYSNFGNGNAITLSRVRLSPSKSLYRPADGADIVLGKGNPLLSTGAFYAWGAAASARIEYGSSQAAFIVMQSNRLQCPGGGTPANLTVIEVMPAPLGVSLGPSSSHINVAVSGHAPVAGLSAGKVYYSTSTGALAEGAYVGWTQSRVGGQRRLQAVSRGGRRGGHGRRAGRLGACVQPRRSGPGGRYIADVGL